MKRRAFLNTVTVVLLAASAGRGADRDTPRQASLSEEFSKGRDLVLPNASERSYRTIPWRISVLQGVVEAHKKDKPVMIVLMNGHPLGCT